jgi:hypothetical protein
LKEAVEAGKRGMVMQADPANQITCLDTFMADVEELRRLFSQVVNCGADDVALVPATSYGIATAAANLPLQQGDRIIVLEQQFMSNYFAWHEKAQKTGACLVVVPFQPDYDWTTAILKELSQGAAVVSLPNVHWTGEDQGASSQHTNSSVCMILRWDLYRSGCGWREMQRGRCSFCD